MRHYAASVGIPSGAPFSVGLRDVHPPDRQGLPGPCCAVHLHAPASILARAVSATCPSIPGGLAASVALRHLPHADQRVRPGPQHHLLQVPDLGQVPAPASP